MKTNGQKDKRKTMHEVNVKCKIKLTSISVTLRWLSVTPLTSRSRCHGRCGGNPEEAIGEKKKRLRWKKVRDHTPRISVGCNISQLILLDNLFFIYFIYFLFYLFFLLLLLLFTHGPCLY